jgi:hypothetical protein
MGCPLLTPVRQRLDRLLSRQIGEIMYGKFAQAEAHYYSDRLREQLTAECEWHEGNAKNDCPECEGAYDAYCEMLVDMDREERALRD